MSTENHHITTISNVAMTKNASNLRILMVDDHPLLRDGVAALIAVQNDMTIVAEASNGRDALEKFREYRPDITLMDLQMPEMGGEEAIRRIRKEFPNARIIVLTSFSGDAQVIRAMKAGASAYLLKNMLRPDLLDTMRKLHEGKRYLAGDVAGIIAAHMMDSTLSGREIDVLRLMARGCTNKEIGTHLGTTEETIKTHVSNLLSKLGARDRTQAVIIAARRGIIDVLDGDL